MNDLEKRKYAYYLFVVFLILLVIINGIISFSEYNEVKEIKKNPFETTAIVIKEEQNIFGGQKSYRYLLRYNFAGNTYENFEKGIHKHNFYKSSQEINIIMNKKKPDSFVIKDEINKYTNHLLISLFGLLLFLLLVKSKKKII